MMVGDSAPKDTFGCHDVVRKEGIPGTWWVEAGILPNTQSAQDGPTVKNEPAPEVSRLRPRSPELINAMRKARGE